MRKGKINPIIYIILNVIIFASSFISSIIVSNLSFEEIGKLLKEPTGTIKWRYYKAGNTLKILLSNLGMFISTFVIGIKTLFNKKVSDKVEQDKTIGNNTTEQTGENTNAETKKGQENLIEMYI